MEVSEVFNKISNNIEPILMGIGIIVPFVMSWIAIRKSNKSIKYAKEANDLSVKLSSKEHEFCENLKYDVLKMIAVLKSIDSKAACELMHNNDNSVFPDDKSNHRDFQLYSSEVKSLMAIQSSPGYLIFLYSIKNDSERLMIESYFRLLTSKKDLSVKHKDIRGIIHELIPKIHENIDFDEIMNTDMKDLVKKISTMTSTYTDFKFEAWKFEQSHSTVFDQRHSMNYSIEFR